MRRTRRISAASLLFLLPLVLVFLLAPIPAHPAAEEGQALDAAVSAVIGDLQKSGGKEITLAAAEGVVNSLGHPISGSGSHVKGLYTPGISDHDFTMRLGSELGDEEALAAWQTARRRFSTEIKNEAMKRFESQLAAQLRASGMTDAKQIERLIEQARPQAQKLVQQEVVGGILERTNLYPPQQLIGTSGQREALGRFKEWRTVPRLSEEAGKELGQEALEKATEGIYGPGATAYRQGYETKAGVIWEIDPKTGKARKRMIDLTHMAEGYGTFTIEGTSSNAKQWGQKVKDALKEGDYRTAYKDLERLHLDMKKARDLASIPVPGSTGVQKFYGQYNDIKAAARAAFPEIKGAAEEVARANEAARAAYVRESVERLFQENPGLRQEIEAAVDIASREADLLLTFAGEFTANRKLFIRNLLGGSESGSRLRAALGEAYEKYGHHLSFGNFISGVFIALDTAEAASRAGSGDIDGALRKGLEAVWSIPPTLWPVGIMAVITNMIIDAAKDAGYALAVASQDCEDLLAGIISVKGWEDVKSFGDKTETTIDEIARRIPEETPVRNLVAALARNAATGKDGTEVINRGKEEALIAKCSGEIVGKWRKRRMEFIAGYFEMQNRLSEAFGNLNLEVTADPNPARLPAATEAGGASTVTVALQLRCNTPTESINQRLDAMREQIMLLGGQQKIVIQTVTQKTEWVLGDDAKPFASNTRYDQFKTVLDEAQLTFSEAQEAKVVARIRWEIKVVSGITDGADFTSTTIEIIGPILQGELPGYRSRNIPGDVVGTYQDQLGKTFNGKAGTLVSVLLPENPPDDKGKDKDKDKDKASGPDSKDGEKTTKADTPSIIAQPESYTKGFDVGDTGKKDDGEKDETRDKGDKGAKDTTGDTTVKNGADGNSQNDQSTKPVDGTTPVDVTKGDTGKKPPPPPPPACAYEYSAFGDCNRASKTWTRTVVGKKPAECVEKDKPILSEGCTPPPTEEEKRLAYLNCLCKMCGGSAGGYYNPSGDGKPCSCFGWLSGWPTGLNADPKVVADCYKSAYGKSPTPGDVDKAVRNAKKENKKYQTPLKVTLSPEKCPVQAQPGDIITFTAGVEGGAPSNTVSWSGNGEAKDRTFTFANSRKRGTYPITVTVVDEDGTSVTKTCSVIVNAFTVVLKIDPAKGKLLVGSTVKLSAEVKAGKDPARGSFLYRWQPHPEADFGDAFETTGGSTSASSAKLTKIGPVKFWVDVLQKEGEVATTVGESNQIAAEVVGPQFQLAVTPETPLVGQEVKAVVSAPPELDAATIDFWWEYQGNVLNPGSLRDNREYTFKPKDTKPVTITVHGKAKDGGADLGEKKAVVTARGYQVTVSGPKLLGPPPLVWTKNGMVEAYRGIAEFQDFIMKAAIEPKPPTESLRYDWSVTPEGCGRYQGAGQEIKTQCDKVGSYTAKATIRDDQGVEIGSGAGAISVSVTQESAKKAVLPAVALTAEKLKLKLGESTKVTAAADRGKPPFQYAWTGDVAGQGESATCTPKKIGTAKVAVAVTDAAGGKAEASLDLTVEADTLAVTLAPDKPKLKLGESATIKAAVKGGKAPYAWTWSGEAVGKGESATLTPKKAGALTLKAAVADAPGNKGEGSLAITVDPAMPVVREVLEVRVTPGKTTLKVGEETSLKAEVKGGVPPYTYVWSGGATGSEATGTFGATRAGVSRVEVKAQDSQKNTGTATLEVRVEEAAAAAKAAIEPETVQVTPGGSVPVRAFTIGADGAKAEVPAAKVGWVVDPYYGISVWPDGKVTAGASAKIGTKVKLTARIGSATVIGSVEVVATATSSPAANTAGATTAAASAAPATTSAAASKSTPTTTATAPVKTPTATEQASSALSVDDTIVGLAVEPKTARGAPGSAVQLRAFALDLWGKKALEVTGKATWSVSPATGAQVSRDGALRIAASASAGALFTVTAQYRGGMPKAMTAAATVEVALTGALSNATSGYDPRNDPASKQVKPTVDTAHVDAATQSFQKEQWGTLDTRDAARKDNAEPVQQPETYTKKLKVPGEPDKKGPGDKVGPDGSSKDGTSTGNDDATTTKDGASSTRTNAAGIDVQVVGTAPPGKCRIVTGQLVAVENYPKKIAGLTVTLEGAAKATAVSNQSGAFTFSEIPAGDYTISVKEWNYGMTKQKFSAPSGKSVKIVLKGSCPYLYVWTGARFERENDLYPVARLLPQELAAATHSVSREEAGLLVSQLDLERIPATLRRERTYRDVYRVTRPMAADRDGRYRLRIVEQASEHSFTDFVSLRAVDHAPGGQVGVTRGGDVFFYARPQQLAPSGLAEMPTAGLALYHGESVEVRLPAEAFDGGVLVLSWQGFLDGTAAGHSFATGQPKLAVEYRDEAGRWLLLDWVAPRDERQDSHVLLDLPGARREVAIRVVATSCLPEKYHRIDRIALAHRVGPAPEVATLAMRAATTLTGSDAMTLLTGSDGDSLHLGPGEEVDISFDAPQPVPGLERAFLVLAEGFYLPVPMLRLAAE